ncbi:ATP synthase d subunit [Serendipita sp. 399]|nr:ATP synthase d subunit [Serendipita sp. 399]
MAARAATKTAVDFTKIYSTLGLGKETVSALQAFRKRHADAQRIHGTLSSQPTTVDFVHYRSILKNQSIVNEAEKLLKDFKPTTYDVSAHVKAIDQFEAKAASCRQLIVENAEATAAGIDVELKALQATLANIEDARPFDDLTVEDVGKAHPQILETVETMVKKGKWTVPGYKEKFGDLNVM